MAIGGVPNDGAFLGASKSGASGTTANASVAPPAGRVGFAGTDPEPVLAGDAAKGKPIASLKVVLPDGQQGLVHVYKLPEG
jgi:hypothetical protein